MKKLRSIMYELPKYLPFLPVLVAAFFIISALCIDDPISIVGNGGRFNKSYDTVLSTYSYYFIMLIGIASCVLASLLRREIFGLGKPSAIVLPILFGVQAFVGAKIMAVVEEIVFSGELTLRGLLTQSMFGGCYMIFLYAFIVSKATKKDMLEVLDFFAPFAMILLAFVRTACFVDGCCGASLCYVGDKKLYFPIQLVEVAIDIIILAVIFHIENKYFNIEKNGKKKKHPNIYRGKLIFIALISYGACRFIIEFFRSTKPGVLGILTAGQLHSVIVIAIGAIALSVQRKRAK